MNLVIWDVETTGSNTSFCSIIEIGGILVDENFKEKDRFSLRCRLPEGEIPSAQALIINKTSVDQLTKANLSHYQMLGEIEKVFKRWSPAIFLGWSNVGFDDEMLRKEFFKSIRDPYITNKSPNKRHDGLNIARGAYAIDPNVLKTELNDKNNPVFKLESLSRINGFDASDAHSALFDAQLTCNILKLIKSNQPSTWDSFLKTASRNDTETIIKKEKIITINEYFYGRSRLYLCAPLHQDHCTHPIYKWGQAVDLRVDVAPLIEMSISELKIEMKKTPKFLRTIRSNKAAIIIDAKYGMNVEPYNAIDPSIIQQRANLIKENENFAKKVQTVLREIAEEKEQSKSQEDILDEESIYEKFTSNKDTLLFEQWHKASWKEKLKLLDKFDDARLVKFGKKIIYQEAPEVLPKDMYRSIKSGIARRILSQNKEKWWTVKECLFEVENLHNKYTEENDVEKLKFLDQFHVYVRSIEEKYENT